ncbi:MAG: class I SAM-dependent methyltransferase [Persicimonas sp.]
MSTDAIRRYYRQFDEWARLDSPAGQLELHRCLEILDEHLEDESRVLDLGGGPGRYTIELARRGHRVTLVDLMDEHVERAEREFAHRGLLERVEGLYAADARDLTGVGDGGLAEDSFDAVVAFGPFYHLIDAESRRLAAAELARVLRPSGRAFVQFLPPKSGLVRVLDRAAEHPEQVDRAILERARHAHIFQNLAGGGFQEGYYAEPADIERLFATVGLQTDDVVSARGIAAGREDKLVQIRDQDPQLYAAFCELIDQTARDADVIAFGQIAVWVGTRTS